MSLKDLQNKFHEIIHALENDSIAFVEALGHSIEANGGQVLRDAAKAAVEAAETTGGSGEDKAKAALASVIAVLEAEGIPIILADVKGAIEASVANLRAL